MPPPKLRRIVWIVAGVATACYLGGNAWIDYRLKRGHETTVEAGPDVGPILPQAELMAPTFRLMAHTGEPVTEETWRGDWLLVFFGYTNGLETCPTTLAGMAAIMDGLGPQADKVQPLVVSVDPARDSRAELAEYVAAFHPEIVGLTGSEADIAATSRSFKARYAKEERPGAPDGYAFAHTSAIYLIAPDGLLERVYSYGTPFDEVLEDLQRRL